MQVRAWLNDTVMINPDNKFEGNKEKEIFHEKPASAPSTIMPSGTGTRNNSANTNSGNVGSATTVTNLRSCVADQSNNNIDSATTAINFRSCVADQGNNNSTVRPNHPSSCVPDSKRPKFTPVSSAVPTTSTTSGASTQSGVASSRAAPPRTGQSG